MNQWKRGMEKWGHYLLALLCAGVILLSAAWTRDQKAQERMEQAALSDQSQKMAQAEAEKAMEDQQTYRPAAGLVAAPYVREPVLDAETNVWRTHPYLDFFLQPGDAVYAMMAGQVLQTAGEIRIDHGDGLVSRYQGKIAVSAAVGRQVQAGEKIGFYSGGEAGLLRVALLKNNAYRAFGEGWE